MLRKGYLAEADIVETIYILNPDLTILAVSSSVKALLGYRPEELVGRKLTGKDIIAPEYATVLQEHLKGLLTSGSIPPSTYELITRDGMRKEVELKGFAIEGIDRTAGLVLIVNDGGALMQRELAVEKRLIQADKMISLGVLVSGIAHEINNPNNFIMVNTPILKQAWQDVMPILEKYYLDNGDFGIAGLPFSEIKDEIPQLISGIEEGSRRIQRIVADLRDYARIDSGKLDRSVNINNIVKRAVTLINNMIKKSTDKFSATYESDIPLIKGNPQRLEQVVINLIQNACQALSSRDQAVCVSTLYDKQKQNVVIEVRDEGIGIDQGTREKIMDPFFTTKRAGEGTGLGLAVSEKISREHGGWIEVSSSKGKGSVFRLVLPTDNKRKRIRVLIVDDDVGFRSTMQEALQQHNEFDVDTASNGVEACIKIGRFLPDILVLDIMMPGMDGVEVCNVIKNRPELSGVKVLIVTGFVHSYKVKKLKQMGFLHFLVKPFDFDTFLKEIIRLTGDLCDAGEQKSIPASSHSHSG